MRTKILSLCFMLCLVVLAVISAPKEAAACSGDDCGCGTDAIECVNACPPAGDPGRTACVHDCQVNNLHCSVCCCCTEACPLYCY